MVDSILYYSFLIFANILYETSMCLIIPNNINVLTGAPISAVILSLTNLRTGRQKNANLISLSIFVLNNFALHEKEPPLQYYAPTNRVAWRWILLP